MKLKDALKNLAMTVEHIGFVDPMKKVYELSNKLSHMAEFFAVISLYTLQNQLTY